MTDIEGFSTRSVHSAVKVDPITRAIEVPIVLNSAFAFEDISSWRQAALHNVSGDIYSRNTNPTYRRFEERIASLEYADDATSFSTGMAAISCTLFSLLASGKRVVSVKDSYGATYLLFTQILPRFGIHSEMCVTEDSDAIEQAILKGCDIVYMETPTNPTLKVIDLEKISKVGHQVGAIVIVDNTFATPINQNPINLGADLVIHSATKYICGHNDTLGGVVCGKREIIKEIFHFRELTGPSLDPFSAYLLGRSLKTLALRVERQNMNALMIAQFLEGHPKVTRVYYPGLDSHPGYEIAKKQMRGYGGVLSFELKGGLEAVNEFLPRLKYCYLAANLGQVETLVGIPATTSHVECTDEERLAAGIPEGLIRYSVGIEDVEDLINDLTTAFKVL